MTDGSDCLDVDGKCSVLYDAKAISFCRIYLFRLQNAGCYGQRVTRGYENSGFMLVLEERR